MYPPSCLKAAVFDLDGTLVSGDLFELWIVHSLRHSRNLARNCAPETALRKALSLGIRTGLKSHLAALAMHHWVSSEELSMFVNDFVYNIALQRVVVKAIDAMRMHRRAGHVLVLATGSLSIYSEPIGTALGFDAVIATPHDHTAGPANIGLTGPNVRGAIKAELVQLWLHERGIELEHDVVAYSDSMSDFPLLRRSQSAVLVNPKPLASVVGALRGFPIVRWSAW